MPSITYKILIIRMIGNEIIKKNKEINLSKKYLRTFGFIEVLILKMYEYFF